MLSLTQSINQSITIGIFSDCSVRLNRNRLCDLLFATRKCFDLLGAANTQQLRRRNFCSCWTLIVELSSSPSVQSRHHLWTV